MKQVAAILLFGLLTFSFLGDAGILTFEDKLSIELCEDLDAEKEVKEKGEMEKFASFSSSTTNEIYSEANKPSTRLTTRLFNISYTVEIRPPRA